MIRPKRIPKPGPAAAQKPAGGSTATPGAVKPPMVKPTPPRLPHGSEHHTFYDATKERWNGALWVPNKAGDEPIVFTGEARTIFTLLSKLDGKYRNWLKAQEAPK